MNYSDILKEVEEKIKDAVSIGDPDKLLSWLKVLEKMKDCGLVQINKGENKKCQEFITQDKKQQVQS